MDRLIKLDELRLKTDRQLIELVESELALGLSDAHRALESAENWMSAEGHYRLAERAYTEAARVIRLGFSTSSSREGLESKLGRLREVLDALSAIGSTPTGDDIAALARALWKARGCPEGLPEEDWFRAERALKMHSVCVGN